MRHHPNDPAPPPWDSVLDAGERLLWTGRPGFSLLAFCAWAFGVGFLALWLALPVMALTAGEVDRTVTIVASVFLVVGGIALAAQMLSARLKTVCVWASATMMPFCSRTTSCT
ncbi:MAG: hypothetical protein AAFZ09_18950, partial [Pseudomonadota bacterium]